MNKAIRNCLALLLSLLTLPAVATNYRIEYFWNTDPGLGKATQTSVLSAGADGILNASLDASGARQGMNVLGIRAFNGKWGPTTIHYIFVKQSAEALSHIVCEYFWDTDPGIGMGRQISAAVDNGNGIVDLNLDAAGLSRGIHMLGVRTGANGKWSGTVCTSVFVKGDEPERLDKIDRAEYFWGEDPGMGNGTPIDVTVGELVVINDLTIPFPTEVKDNYSLTVRAHSQLGGWGIGYNKIFERVVAKSAAIEPGTLTLGTIGAKEQLVATPNPADSWDVSFLWTSSDEKVATVDNNGNVTAIADGQAVIKATIAGTEIAAECNVTVDDEQKYPLGDSNGSFTVNVADVSMTIDHTLGGKNQPFKFLPADVTKDGELSLADAVGTINIIMGAKNADINKIRRNVPLNFGMTALGYRGEDESKMNVVIGLDNSVAISAIQFDMQLPEGVTLEEQLPGYAFTATGRSDGTHTFAYRTLERPGAYRILMYSGSNSSFSDATGGIMAFNLDLSAAVGDAAIEFTDVRVVEGNAIEHRLPVFSLIASDASLVETTAVEEPEIYVEGNILHIISPRATLLSLTNVNGLSRRLKVKEGHNTYPIANAGIYIVNGKKVVVK